MMSEEDRVQQLMRDLSEGREVGNKLVYDVNTKTIRPASGYNDPDKTLSVTPSDMEHFGRWLGETR